MLSEFWHLFFSMIDYSNPVWWSAVLSVTTTTRFASQTWATMKRSRAKCCLLSCSINFCAATIQNLRQIMRSIEIALGMPKKWVCCLFLFAFCLWHLFVYRDMINSFPYNNILITSFTLSLYTFLKDIQICTESFRASAFREFTSQSRQIKSNMREQQIHLCWCVIPWVLRNNHVVISFLFLHFLHWISPYSSRVAYEMCIDNSARRKCRPESALFAKSIAQLLSNERHFVKCHKYEKNLCSSSSSMLSSLVNVLLFFAMGILCCF